MNKAPLDGKALELFLDPQPRLEALLPETLHE